MCRVHLMADDAPSPRSHTSLFGGSSRVAALCGGRSVYAQLQICRSGFCKSHCQGEVMTAAVALVLLPTMVWCVIWCSVRPANLPFRWLIGGMILGIVIGGPVWVVESAVDDLANPAVRFSRDFIQQVLGAACSEELLKFTGVGLLVWWANHHRESTTQQVVAIAISVGIGFMTLENLVAVVVSDMPMSLAMDRQITVLAGHPSYQVIMGYLLAMSIERRRVAWGVVALVVPMLLHGCGDFSERLFQDEPRHGSVEDTILYGLWLATIAFTTITAFALLACLRRSESMTSSTSITRCVQ